MFRGFTRCAPPLLLHAVLLLRVPVLVRLLLVCLLLALMRLSLSLLGVGLVGALVVLSVDALVCSSLWGWGWVGGWGWGGVGWVEGVGYSLWMLSYVFLIRRHTPFPPDVAPRFPHMSEIDSLFSFAFSELFS